MFQGSNVFAGQNLLHKKCCVSEYITLMHFSTLLFFLMTFSQLCQEYFIITLIECCVSWNQFSKIRPSKYNAMSMALKLARILSFLLISSTLLYFVLGIMQKDRGFVTSDFFFFYKRHEPASSSCFLLR